MSRDPIIEEIRRAQSAVRRSRPPETMPDAYGPGEGSEVKAMIGELFQRIDRTQEHLLRTIAERTTTGGTPVAKAPRATPVTGSPGSPTENAILAEILAKLDGNQVDGVMGDRLAQLEARVEQVLSSLENRSGSVSPGLLEPMVDRLDAIERRLRVVADLESGAHDWIAVTDEIQKLAEKIETVGQVSTVEGGATVSLEPVTERLGAIEERIGGDAGAMTLGAAIARLSESIERVETGVGSIATAEGTSAGPGLDPEWTKKIEETLESIANSGDDDGAIKAISTLKRDFSLLVHTINGHLQESRHRSEKVENALEVIVSALAPIARSAGVELEVAPELEKESESEKEADLA